jgi:hypothetical protein
MQILNLKDLMIQLLAEIIKLIRFEQKNNFYNFIKKKEFVSIC